MENKAENKTVVLQGFEPTLTKEMVWTHFKKGGIKYITLNPKKVNAYLEFETEKHAKDAIDNNFGKPILKKPVAMAFKSDKTGSFVEFHILGLDATTLDLNTIYRICSKFGKSCKFRFNLRTGSNKPSSGGYLSYASITPAETQSLTKQLETGALKIQTFNKEKTKKVSVKIDNFIEPFQVQKTLLVEKIAFAESKLKQALTQLCQFNEKTDFKLAITARPNEQNLNQLYAYVIFEDQDKAIKFFEEIKKTKATYFTVNPQIGIRITEESESLANLFSIGLVKTDASLSDEAFEAHYLKVLKQQFKGILQVSIRPMRKKTDPTTPPPTTPVADTYLAFITLDSEDHGKQLLATYNKDPKRSSIKGFYKGEPFFNIFISSNLKKQLFKAKEGFKRMEKDIKNFGDNMRKQEIEFNNVARRRGPYPYPVMGNPMGNPLNTMGHPLGNPMGNPMGNPLNPMGNPLAGGMMRPPMPIGMPGMNPMGAVNPMNPLANQAPVLSRADLLKQKDTYLTKDASTVKRLIFHTLKGDIQQIIPNSNQATMLANKILFDSDLATLFGYLQNKEEIKKKIQLLTQA